MTAMVPHVVIFGAKFSEPPTSARPRPILYTTIDRLRSAALIESAWDDRKMDIV
jgi:hypothetical protein